MGTTEAHEELSYRLNKATLFPGFSPTRLYEAIETERDPGWV